MTMLQLQLLQQQRKFDWSDRFFFGKTHKLLFFSRIKIEINSPFFLAYSKWSQGLPFKKLIILYHGVIRINDNFLLSLCYFCSQTKKFCGFLRITIYDKIYQIIVYQITCCGSSSHNNANSFFLDPDKSFEAPKGPSFKKKPRGDPNCFTQGNLDHLNNLQKKGALQWYLLRNS